MRFQFTPTFYSGRDTAAEMLKTIGHGGTTPLVLEPLLKSLEGAVDGPWSAFILCAALGERGVASLSPRVQLRLESLFKWVSGTEKPQWVEELLKEARMSEKIDDGGPAFPHTEAAETQIAELGMSLRVWLAAHAPVPNELQIQAEVINDTQLEPFGAPARTPLEIEVDLRYAWADAMIERQDR